MSLAPLRRKQLERLLESWEDWIPVPGQRLATTPTAAIKGGTTPSGLLQIRCPRCEKRTGIVGRFCDTCLKETRAQSEREERRITLREELGDGRVSPAERAALVNRKQAHYHSGSFRELEAAMRELRRRQPYTAWVLMRVYVDQLPTGTDEARRRAALRALSDLMPEVIMVPVHPDALLLDAADRQSRDQMILGWSEDGLSTRQIAGRAGLTQPRVVQILARQRASVAAVA